MTYHFENNEFTSWEILEFMKNVYGAQINGSPFTNWNVQNWIRMRKLPELYGGHRIIKTERFKELNNLLVLTIENLHRCELTDLVGYLPDFKETLNKRRAVDKIAYNKKPRKQRTGLYYQILAKAGKQYTKKTIKQATLPEDWAGAGVKGNQLTPKAKKKRIL
jgi:hypothetical protein